MSYLTNPPIVQAYFGEDAFIVEDYHPERGWQRYAMRKRISRSWARKLKTQGVISVALVPVSNPSHPPVDFMVAEILKAAR